MQLTFKEVKANPYVNNYIEQTEKYLTALGFTDHGFRHVNIVADRARSLAREIGLPAHDQELSASAGYCHDMGNFMGRTQHHYWGALLFSQIYVGRVEAPDLSRVIQAITSHDKDELKLVDKISAILILADKSDVQRTRVLKKDISHIKFDIHDRVNYAATQNSLNVDRKKKIIYLNVKIDTKVAEPIEYFEIFIDRMTFCRLAAKYLGYRFELLVNNFRLS